MKNRIVLIAAFLTVFGSVFGVSATSAQAASAIDNYKYGCIQDPGHGGEVTTGGDCASFTLIQQASYEGNTWYLAEMNGNSGNCLNEDPDNGFVYADSCQTGDQYEEWNFHQLIYNSEGQVIGFAMTNYWVYYNLGAGTNGYGYLMTCNPNDDARLMARGYTPTGCNRDNSYQYTWDLG
jgi:hypothetical protein